ncbi:SH3 domain-containing protein [Rhodobacter lacus]|uniref:SH3 domain-containing protein n=1 Tax=Rhodobacter lacus TaxID=1641972 RepID=A0ABW5AA77_9RHOB
MTLLEMLAQFSCAPVARLRRHATPLHGFSALLHAGIVVALIGVAPLAAQELEDDPPLSETERTVALSTQSGRGPVTNLPLPRFVSLKGSDGNARRGPSLSHRIDWVFKHAGMPLRVTAEFGHWRRVEDRDGAGGWVHYALLSGVRTVIVEDDMTELHARADATSAVVALAEMGAIAKLGDCTRDWCEITAESADGWVPKEKIWGVDADEIRD